MKLQRLINGTFPKWVVLSAFAIPVLQMSVPSNSFGLAQMAQARDTETPAFEIKIEQEKINRLVGNFTIEEKVKIVEEVDPLAERKTLLKEYLESRGSRFAEYSDVLAEQPEWRKITSIAFAESTLGEKCYYNNCWGIGGYPPKLRKYPTLAEGIVDANKVLSGRLYQGKTYEQMCGIYVQPCNRNWLKANYQIATQIAHIP